ncbi:MAG: type II toxin-antitoxin system death-on-curing family toxin [Chloroflexota bacterium]
MPSQNDKPLRILSAADIYTINETVTNRAPFVRDHQVLHSAVKRPYLILFGEEQFPTLLDKAAATLHSIAAHHIFVDGNKRTAARATALFLEANGIQPTWTDDASEAFILTVARGDADIETISAWLADHTQPLPPEEEKDNAPS